jgi:aminomethyltransferase
MAQSPLYDEHVRLGARFVDFAGWEMPVQYESVLAEHEAVRTAAGIFDVSHLGRFRLEGSGSTDLLRSLLCNDIGSIEPGRAQYTMALNESGGVEDDIIVWRWDHERYWVIPNGANDDRIRASFLATAGPNTSIEDLREDTVLIAVQGPDAPAVIESVLGRKPGRFRLFETEFIGYPVWVAGTGYTGERGGEIAAPAAAAAELFAAFLEAGVIPAGLGSRDTLRLEMGYPLWGQDLDPGTTPLEAGLEWVINWDHDFVGKSALQAQKHGGVAKQLVGFAMEGRQIARHGYPLRAGESTGVVTSGNFSPTLKHGIGLGYLEPPPSPDLQVEVEVRGSWLPVIRQDPPFLERI